MFDALTGRLITMYLPDPGRAIAALAGQLRPGGVVLLEEFAMSSLRQHPETPVLRAAMGRVIATSPRWASRPIWGSDSATCSGRPGSVRTRWATRC